MQINKIAKRILLLSCLEFTLISTTLYSAFASPLKAIVVNGNQRISDATIISYLNMNIGEEIKEEKNDRALKALFDTGYFADVKVTTNSNIVVIDVVENPMINLVAFEGNSNINTKDLEAEINMKQRSVLSQNNLQSDVNRIIGLYHRKGLYSVKINPKVIKLDHNRVNLVYEITEGTEARIVKIQFSGNKSFSKGALSSIIASQEKRWYKFFSNADVYDPDKIEYDCELIRQFYLNNGFATVNIASASAELTSDRDAFVLTYAINEGDVYTFGNISAKSFNSKITNTELLDKVSIKSGNIFNQQDINTDVETITDYIAEHGFVFSDVEPELKINRTTKTVDIVFNVHESPRMYVNKIRIFNNTKTLDKVVRREFKLAEGDPFNAAKLRRSEQNLQNLGFFSKVEMKNRRTSQEDKMDIDVEVEETSTGALNFGIGYNTSSGPLGSITASEDNFLGKGQKVALSVSKARKENSQTFSFTEPYFMDRPLSAGLTAFNSERDLQKESSYTARRIGGGLNLGYKLTEYLTHSINYQIASEKIGEIASNSSKYIQSEAGKFKLSLISHNLFYDKLDNNIEPSRGYMISADQSIAGLGGDIRYISHGMTIRYYKPISKKDLIFSARLTGENIFGYSSQSVRLSDRFMPGQDLIRGFDFGGFGPRDISSEDKDAIGAKTVAGISLELKAPISLVDESIFGIIFVDSGTAFGYDKLTQKQIEKYGDLKGNSIKNSHSIRISVGPALEWKSPIGVIGISYGVPLKKEKFDVIERFYFNYGTRF